MDEVNKKQSAPTPVSAKLKPGDIDFVANARAAMAEDTPKGGRYILWLTILFLAVALFWANQAELDEVTRGQGKVIPSSEVQVVQNLEGGILAEILVKEGQIVNKGQVMLRIDDTRFSSSFRESQAQLSALKAKAARLRAEANDIPFQAPEDVLASQPDLVERERNLLQSHQQELTASKGVLEQQMRQHRQELEELKAKQSQLRSSHNLAVKELKLTEPLVAQGAVSEVEVLRLRRQVSDLYGELRQARLAEPRIGSKLDEIKGKMEGLELEFRNKSKLELNEVISELQRITESNTALEDRVLRTSVRSPVKGTVKQLMINTVGGIIQPGMELVEVVPLEDTLLVEAKIRPKDIGFLSPGQEAIVKFTAYDFAIYGGLDAQLEHISADTILDEQDESFYLVKVRTQKNFLGDEKEPLPIIPGMQAEVDILTGKKTVLSYLLKPVLRAQQRAFTER